MTDKFSAEHEPQTKRKFHIFSFIDLLEIHVNFSRAQESKTESCAPKNWMYVEQKVSQQQQTKQCI